MMNTDAGDDVSDFCTSKLNRSKQYLIREHKDRIYDPVADRYVPIAADSSHTISTLQAANPLAFQGFLEVKTRKHISSPIPTASLTNLKDSHNRLIHMDAHKGKVESIESLIPAC